MTDTTLKRVLAIDASRMAFDRSGIENYLHHLLPHLIRAWTSAGVVGRSVRVFGSRPDVVAHLRPPLEVTPGGGPGWTQLRLAPVLRKLEASVYFSPIPILPLAGGLPCPAVVTVHDLHEFRPRWWYFRRLLGRTFGQAARVVCVSQATQAEVIAEFPSAAEKCVVVHHGANPEVFFPAPSFLAPSFPASSEWAPVRPILSRLGIPAPPLLAVGTLQPRKNYKRLVQAYASLGAAAPPLVIVGKPGWDYEELIALPGQLGVEARVNFTGHLDETDVGDLMRSSLALCAVSTGEGFGLPLLEAMSCGLPILAADIPPFREVAGTAAGYVNPLSVDDIAAGLKRLLADGAARRRMAEAGIARRSLFSWERAAADMVEILDRV
jgi:glycosyltransferase involved in cell wall biosynthesis